MLNVKQQLAWIWRNAENILIVVFLTTFTLNIRKIFLTPYSFLNGGFNEYMTISVSWADVLMVGIIIIYNIKLLISQFKKKAVANALLENVILNKSSVIRNYYGDNVSRETFFLLLLLSWTGLSIFWSEFRPIALYRFLTLAEITFFASIAIKSLENGKWLKIAFLALVSNALFQSSVGIAQFIHNGSVGLRFIGESIIGPNIDGVAKIFINGEKHVRAYGTMPHPNILAGFLLLSFFLLVAELLTRRRKVPHETLLGFIPERILYVIILIIGMGFFLTFSRSAFLGFFIALLYYFFVVWTKYNRVNNRDPYAISKILVLITLIVTTTTVIFFEKSSFFSSQSLQERRFYTIVSYETIVSHPLAGVGLGQFVLNEYLNRPDLASWQYQPVHNMYLLIFSELGIIGFSIFLLLTISILSKFIEHKAGDGKHELTNIMFCCIFIAFLTISFFDHYFWDIKIGTIIFALPVIFLLAVNRNQNKFGKN